LEVEADSREEAVEKSHSLGSEDFINGTIYEVGHEIYLIDIMEENND
jgi:hypothetical protein